MKAPPPRSWKLAIGTHAPSPQVFAMAMLGAGLAAAATATSAGSSSSCSTHSDLTKNEPTKPGTKYAGLKNNVPGVRREMATEQTIGSSTASVRSLMPLTQQKIRASSHQNNILATSDASAERSASMAAAARFSGNKSSPFAVNTQNIVKDTASDDAVNNAPELKSNNTAKGSDEIGNNSVDDQQRISNKNNSNNDQTPLPTHPTLLTEDEDSYPTFTPYHHSLLKKYLTPKVWAKLSHLQTSYGTTIEDIIRAGLALPIGANPPRHVGVLVGDAECYTVFSDLLDPITCEYHGIDSYEEWMDPELPMERYFREKAGDGGSGTPATNSGSLSAISPADNDDEYGVIKSSGADEDSDENDDSSFLLDEEDDVFVEYVALPSSSSPSTPLSSSSATVACNVETIASKRKTSLRRHPTIINNPRLVTKREVDPKGKYIVSTRIRIARSLDGVRFPPTMSRSDRRQVQRLIQDCTQHFQGPNLANGTYLPVLAMSNDQNLDLIERHILFDNPNEWTIASGLGRDWPDGRALYANVNNLQSQTPDFMIWVNEEDHLRIMCLRDGGDIQGVFTTVINGIRELERELQKRGWHFAYDPRLGYLTSCPTNVGTTMRASVHVRLTNLGRLPGFFELVERLKLEVRGKYGETDRHYTKVFDISNAERLGKSEVHLINVMVEGVAKLIELERRLEAGEKVNIDEIARG
mmetsp:Transcript_13010/g.28255  ORF Transcript_13010/g.28255 Transcript_13010/m.28255 type:complete len:697 (+) Transcript_13010:89-2179(+)|eukprot:CAMPEP_0172318156 /NCGR_PEP_ID=MMETSP1058-20130122/33986_1 /TAXON_ID=83371 /ORGANISM="Detonula confervacea, Strain CCMP 353" /LENGTH=696 /DNA_ID=CAMNT_0013032907 /DNA_START=41 /DNA_END=2131 /DNA_ORIENTATION=-